MSGSRMDVLTVAELIKLAKDQLSLPRDVRVRKQLLIAYIETYASPQLIAVMEAAAIAKSTNRKRQREEVDFVSRVEPRLETEIECRAESGNYLKLPDPEEWRRCYSRFHAATGMDVLRGGVCAVCARGGRRREDGVERVRLDSLQNRSRLHPREAHIAHDLYDGCLLEPAGVRNDAGSIFIDICRSCRDDLKRPVNEPPKFSLANNLWIGKVPAELAILTVPEQMLVAQLFPRVYVFKLFPKAPGFRPPKASLQRAMRGTVSTYELDTQGIANMVDGKLLPRPPSVLASVISVTFVGVGPLPKRWLRYTFRVRREVVRCALRRLQGDHRHYADMVISEDRLAALPEDDVPGELLAVVRQCNDAGASLQEGAGYVPLDEDGEDEDYLGGVEWGEEEREGNKCSSERHDEMDEEVDSVVSAGT